MSFQTEVYPHRNDRQLFPTLLLRKVDAEFTSIEAAGGTARQSVGGQRCDWRFNQGKGWWYGAGRAIHVCDYQATLTDKKVVKVLLRAWLRQISDRYLDRQALRVFERRPFTSHEAAYDAIRQNAPGGAVKLLYNELAAATNGPLALFGPNLPAHLTYNQYFSQMLAWDDAHCFGLVAELNRLKSVLTNGGGSSLAAALQAAANFISENGRREGTLYNRMRADNAR